MATFTQWDADTGIMLAGSIKRASSSDSKVWGENIDANVGYGVFVAVNPNGGVTAITSGDNVIHGIVVRDIYVDKAPKEKIVNIGHFSHGDCVVAQATDASEFNRGDRAYIVASGGDAGKVTNVKDGAIDLGYWVEEVSNGNKCVAITLGYTQTAYAAVNEAKGE